jgi:hypothetical protein
MNTHIVTVEWSNGVRSIYGPYDLAVARAKYDEMLNHKTRSARAATVLRVHLAELKLSFTAPKKEV